MCTVLAPKTTAAHLGSEALTEELCVVMVSTVSTPREIRPGTELTVSQKEIQDNMTMRMEGMYICTT